MDNSFHKYLRIPVSEVECMVGPHLPSRMEAEPLGHRREQDEELLVGS